MNATTPNVKIIIQKLPAGSQYTHVVNIHIDGTMHLSRMAVTETHAAIIASHYVEIYPSAKLSWS